MIWFLSSWLLVLQLVLLLFVCLRNCCCCCGWLSLASSLSFLAPSSSFSSLPSCFMWYVLFVSVCSYMLLLSLTRLVACEWSEWHQDASIDDGYDEQFMTMTRWMRFCKATNQTITMKLSRNPQVSRRGESTDKSRKAETTKQAMKGSWNDFLTTSNVMCRGGTGSSLLAEALSPVSVVASHWLSSSLLLLVVFAVLFLVLMLMPLQLWW